MTDTNNKPTIQESLDNKSVKKSLFVRLSLFLLFAVGVICMALGTIKYVNSLSEDSVLDRLPEIPLAAKKNELLAQALAKADRDLRQMPLSDLRQKFGQKAGQLGELYHGNDLYSEALACYEIAMEFDPENPRWPHHIAFLRQSRGETESVIGPLKRTIKLAENYIPAVLKLADVYYKMEKSDQAKIYYQQTLTIDPRNKFALLGLSRIALDSSKWKQGQDYLEKALESDPDFGAAHRLLVSVHNHFGRTELMAASQKKAGEELKKVRNPTAPDPWSEQVNFLCYDVEKLLRLGNKAQQMYYIELSQRYFQRAFMFDHDDPEPFYVIGTDVFESGLKNEAKAFFEKVIRIDPGYAKAYNKLGSILLSEQKDKDAERMFLKALEYDPENAYVYFRLGGSQFQQGNYEEALPSFTKALEIDPDVEALNYNLAHSLHKLGRIDQAINYYHEQLKLEPEHKNARFLLAQAFLEKNQIQSAVKQYRLLLQTDPDSVNALNSLAWILATTEDTKSKDPVEAIQLAKHACELTNYKRPVIIDTLAVAYAADGQFQQATETAKKALGMIKLSGNGTLREKIQKRIELYKAHQPYRESLPE